MYLSVNTHQCGLLFGPVFLALVFFVAIGGVFAAVAVLDGAGS